MVVGGVHGRPSGLGHGGVGGDGVAGGPGCGSVELGEELLVIVGMYDFHVSAEVGQAIELLGAVVTGNTLTHPMSAVTRAFRVLLKAQKKTFANDQPMQTAALQEIRKHFRANAGLTDPVAIRDKVQEALEAAEFLEKGVIQAQRRDANNFSKSLVCSRSDVNRHGSGTATYCEGCLIPIDGSKHEALAASS